MQMVVDYLNVSALINCFALLGFLLLLLSLWVLARNRDPKD
jgi:hypothetical protein